MKLAILQPGYLPWLGFFDQLAQCDRFVLYDDVQFTRRDWRSRNRIKAPGTAEGWQWLTVPVKNRGNYHALINEIEIDYDANWPKKHLGVLRANYSRAPYFNHYFPGVSATLETRFQRLVDLDITLIQQCAAWLGITTPMVCSSELGISGHSTERLVAVCESLGATQYLTGNAARDYLEEPQFHAKGIQVEWHNYEHPHYPQPGPDFLPFMCILDLLFNCGEESLKILTHGRFEKK